MKNTKVLFLTLLLSAGCLAACGKQNGQGKETEIVIPTASETKEFGDVEKKPAEKLLLNKKMVSIMVGEQTELVGKTRLYSTGKNLEYKIDDATIASISETGEVKGLKQGRTKITVTDKDNPHLSVEVPVLVNKSLSSSEKASMIENFKAVGETEVRAIINNETYEKSIFKNGKLQKYLVEDEVLVASYDDAYFRITETDSETITENGAINIANYEWIFYTNPFYDTIVYHTTGDVKNYYPVATQSYMEGERYKPMFEILDNLFTSGSEVFTNTFRYVPLTSVANMAASEEEGLVGSAGANCMMFTSSASWPTDTADQDTETRYGIPFGTLTPTTQTMRFTIEDNKVKNIDIDIVITYTIGEDDYEEIYHIVYNYERLDEQKSQIIVPNRKDYTLVDYLFAI